MTLSNVTQIVVTMTGKGEIIKTELFKSAEYLTSNLSFSEIQRRMPQYSPMSYDTAFLGFYVPTIHFSPTYITW